MPIICRIVSPRLDCCFRHCKYFLVEMHSFRTYSSLWGGFTICSFIDTKGTLCMSSALNFCLHVSIFSCFSLLALCLRNLASLLLSSFSHSSLLNFLWFKWRSINLAQPGMCQALEQVIMIIYVVIANDCLFSLCRKSDSTATGSMFGSPGPIFSMTCSSSTMVALGVLAILLSALV